MAGRRQFGSLRHLPSGRWQARYRLPSGEMVPAPVTFLTRGDAGRWLASVETDRTRGLWLDPRAGRMRLEDYSKDWLESRVRLAPRTREIYDLQLRLHILPVLAEGVPALGNIALAELTPELIRLWYATLTKQRSASVAAKAYVRLRQILRQAVNDDRIGKNPCRIDQGGVERTPEQRFVSLPELYALAGAVPDRYRALILTAGLAGLRQGELFALSPIGPRPRGRNGVGATQKVALGLWRRNRGRSQERGRSADCLAAAAAYCGVEGSRAAVCANRCEWLCIRRPDWSAPGAEQLSGQDLGSGH